LIGFGGWVKLNWSCVAGVQVARLERTDCD
jgi:hypothetical protein